MVWGPSERSRRPWGTFGGPSVRSGILEGSGGHSVKPGTGRGTLGEVRGTHGKVRGALWEVRWTLGEVRGTLGEVWDGSG